MNTETVKLWPANSLPVPFERVFSASEEVSQTPEVIVDDDYSKGRIYRYFPCQGYGYIKDRAEREVYFNLSEMDIIGPKGAGALKEGMLVGYDLTRAGKDLHVKKMKVY